MAVVYHEIYLPIDTESTFDYIVIKQGDAGTHRVRATLISNNRVYTIPTSGASYFMKFRKPDNNYCLVEATVSDNTISAEVTEEMLRVSGTGRGEFMIVSGSEELKTATFHVKIVRETFTSGDVQSHSDFAPFAALLQGAGAAASNANTAAAAANAAARLAEQKAQAIPDDYSDLVAEVAGKADQSNTYTKAQVDGLIEDVTVETDTTLAVSGAPADAAETGRQFGLINESLGDVRADLDAVGEVLTVQYDLSGESTIKFNIGLSNGKWTRNNENYASYYITVPASAKCVHIVANATNGTVYAMLASTDTPVHGNTPVYATGCARTFLPAGEDVILPIPFDCAYIWVTKTLSNTDYSPAFFGFSADLSNVPKIPEIEENVDEMQGYLPHEVTLINKSGMASDKYVSDSTVAGDNWTNNLVDDTGSLYTAIALDVSEYIGQMLVIEIGSSDSHSGVRKFGFCNANNIVSSASKEASLSYSSEGGYLRAIRRITNTHFFFSCSAKSHLRIYVIAQGILFDKVNNDLSAISGSNRNLWPGLATEEFVGTKQITFPEPLPVGIYRFSALVTSSDTDDTVSRVQVLMDSGNTIFNISRNFRSGDAFNATSPITGVVFLASRTTALSANDTAVFADIQLERGQYETSYTPHALSAVDKIVRFTLLNTKYVSTSGDDTNEGDTAEAPLRNIQTAINKGANIIYVDPGIYDESILLNGRQNVIITRKRTGDTDTNTNPRVVINGSGSLAKGIIINGCNGVTIDDIEIANCTQNGLRILRSRNIKVQNCIAHDIYSADMLSDIAHGYLCEYSNVDFYNCLAYNIGTNTIGSGAKHSDGFNIHYTGTVNLYDCKAFNCEDDGVSHHDGCEGAIYGGEFYQCGKGGVASPTHGAKVNVYNVYSHNNKYGLYAESSSDFTSRGVTILNGCAFVNNSSGDVYADSHYDIVAINCKYNTVSAPNITTI